MNKAPDAFRTISEVADWLGTPTHVLRFWESRFEQITPIKRAGGRRYYRIEDMQLLGGIKKLLHEDGHSIKAVQEQLNTHGVAPVIALSPPVTDGAAADTAPEPAPVSEPIADPAKDPASALQTPPESPADLVAKDRAPAPDPAPQAELFENTELEPSPPEEPVLEEAAAKPAPKPVAARKSPRRLSGFGPNTTLPETAAPVSDAPAFRRHPGRGRPAKADPAPDAAKEAASAEAPRQGLFIYDDTAERVAKTPPESPAEPTPETSAQAAAMAAPSLGDISSIPQDPSDDCLAPEPLPLGAECRALVALARASDRPAKLSADSLAPLQALRDQLT
ncbi:MAG: MerR family transcriptional regulator [Mangrovicoccus sp.]|nr:MerR family transcriptional regulator [Mangrovicoccus sp.]